MTEKLLPCPFCGGKAKVASYRTGEDTMGSHVYCTSCDARTTEYEDAYAPAADAIDGWNRRPSAQTHFQGGWIVCSGDGKRFRVWEDGGATWTEDRLKATRYARREDAEAVHREDDDAWSVEPFSPTDALREKSELALQVEDMATIIQRLIRHAPINDEWRLKATEYLQRKGLIGNPLRSSNPAYGGCTCACHRSPGMMHFVACCHPGPDDIAANDLLRKVPVTPDAEARLQLKPLEWSEQHQTHYASNLFGGYSVWEIGGNAYLRAPGDYGGKIVGKTIEDGKLAAVRDIEDRIAALLVDPPANPRERGTE